MLSQVKAYYLLYIIFFYACILVASICVRIQNDLTPHSSPSAGYLERLARLMYKTTWEIWSFFSKEIVRL